MRPSPTSEIRSLVEALGGADTIKREAAIARLAVIGRRAVDRLSQVYADPSTSRDKRIAILQVLEAARDPRALAIARNALRDGGDVAIAATLTLRALLDVPDAAISADALDALVATAVDPAKDRRVRVAAVEALDGIPGELRDRVAAALAIDIDPLPRARTPASLRKAVAADALWQDAMEGRLPDDPAPLRETLHTRALAAPLSSLQKLVDGTKEREMTAATAGRAEAWRAVRGAIHQALALRGSRVALYDLRETIERTTGPLPASYLSALDLIADETCLEPIAAALSHSNPDERWRSQLSAAFVAVVKRLRLPSTSNTLERIRSRWPDAARALNTPSRTRARRKKAGRT